MKFSRPNSSSTKAWWLKDKHVVEPVSLLSGEKKMIVVIKLKWDEYRRNILNGWKKRRNDQLVKVNSARERSIHMLQERYGYSREQAIYQLNKYYSRARLG
jgi:hypothetical protein